MEELALSGLPVRRNIYGLLYLLLETYPSPGRPFGNLKVKKGLCVVKNVRSNKEEPKNISQQSSGTEDMKTAV